MTRSTLQTVFSVRAGAQGRRKGQSQGQKPGRKLSASQTCERSANATDSQLLAQPRRPLPFPFQPLPGLSDLQDSGPEPPPESTWRSAQVAVRWSVTPGTGSREGGANARGGDCAAAAGGARSAERRGGARRAERQERGGTDMDRGEQGRRWQAPAEPRSDVWATPTRHASVAEPGSHS